MAQEQKKPTPDDIAWCTTDEALLQFAKQHQLESEMFDAICFVIEGILEEKGINQEKK